MGLRPKFDIYFGVVFLKTGLFSCRHATLRRIETKTKIEENVITKRNWIRLEAVNMCIYCIDILRNKSLKCSLFQGRAVHYSFESIVHM